MEEWKVYPELSNYEVSSLGRVRNIKTGRILANNVDKDGYFYVGLYQDKKKYRRNIHRLVALTFIPNPDNLPIVDHINQDRQDNRVENLRWTTHKGNSRNTKLNSKVKICDFEGNVIKEFDTIIEAAEHYNIPNDKMCAAAVVNSKIQGYITYA
jgi:hypothetical protein